MQAKGIVLIGYGLWVAAGGVWRYAEAASANALGFGGVMGALALLGGVLLLKQKRLAGLILSGLAVLFVAGFFAFKSSEDGIDLRVGVTLAFSALAAVALLWPARGAKPASPDS